ncbi:acetyl-CoA C-acyltransferase [Sporichthya sp.]|uniref:thiolase family protein n=1 Tax=Sporichthya sp. TaxID=65475 RepID=UPI0017AC2D59|nr:acetyl-CoA C-acyltransferase [Sporichthya sp.]MBA3743224.1 acetyl-CoA C-acyltransferase [Sporichthya sp.]
MREVCVVDAVRSPYGKRRGAFSGLHATDLLGQVLHGLLNRTGVNGDQIDQVIGGCVSQAGMQTSNLTRWAWLTAGLAVEVPATTIDAQCGSSQQALTLGTGLIGSGLADAIVCCGVEMMSRVPMGSPVPADGSLGTPVTDAYRKRYEYTSQFDSADRIAAHWGLGREDCDAFAQRSQDAAARAVAAGRFTSQIIPITVTGNEGELTVVNRDQGPRPTTIAGLAGLDPVNGPGGIHTAGSSSQMTDGASALLLMAREKADALGLRPLATVHDTILIGSDPVLKLTGPIPATTKVLKDNGLTMQDIDVIEINEAFAAVVLAWQQEHGPDPARVNPNGGAIALGHPLGATGAGLVAKAVHELIHGDGELALVTACCGGGMATATLLYRS